MAGLSDLKRLKKQIDAAAAQAKAEKAAATLAAKRQAAARNLFQTAMGKVQLLPPTDLADLKPTPPAPLPLQHELDAAAALQESLSDEVDVTTLLDTDDHLSFRRPGVGMDVAQKLRKGKWSIQRQIDLHGLRSDEARDALGSFIREALSLFVKDAAKVGWRCVRVVHGKGLGSPGKTPVLKGKVQSWLIQKQEVLAFVQARPAEGGAGALVVLLLA